MDEQDFWQQIETAWAFSPKLNEFRKEALEKMNKRKLVQIGDYGDAYVLEITRNLETVLHRLNKEVLTEFVRHFERLLFTLDRQDIYQAMGGDNSGDGFLYARSFVIGLGYTYYSRIIEKPRRAIRDTEAGAIAFAGYMVYEKQFGTPLQRELHHPIESFLNNEHW